MDNEDDNGSGIFVYYFPVSLQGQFPSGGVNNRLSAPNLNGGPGDHFLTMRDGIAAAAPHINAIPRSSSLDAPSTPTNNRVSVVGAPLV